VFRSVSAMHHIAFKTIIPLLKHFIWSNITLSVQLARAFIVARTGLIVASKSEVKSYTQGYRVLRFFFPLSWRGGRSHHRHLSRWCSFTAFLWCFELCNFYRLVKIALLLSFFFRFFFFHVVELNFLSPSPFSFTYVVE